MHQLCCRLDPLLLGLAIKRKRQRHVSIKFLNKFQIRGGVARHSVFRLSAVCFMKKQKSSAHSATIQLACSPVMTLLKVVF